MRGNRPRAGLMQWISSLLAASVLTGALLAWGATQPQAAEPIAAIDDRQERLDALSQRVEGTLRAARAAAQAMDRESFDLAARQQAIGSDADALFAWVRDETRWAPYRGVLRGGQGVLMDRTGSHLDRALLLAELLEHAGYDVRLAHASLDDAAVSGLGEIAERTLSHAGALEPAEDFDLQMSLEQMARLMGEDAGTLKRRQADAELRSQQRIEQVIERGLEQSERLSGMLGWDDQPTADAGLDEALADHWWVQIERDGQWVDLDVAEPTHEPGEALAEAQATHDPDALPAEQHHRLRLEVVAEQWDDGQLNEHTAVSHAFNATELTGRPIELTLEAADLPDPGALMGGEIDDPDAVREALQDQEQWLAILNIDGELMADQLIVSDGTVRDEPVSPQQEALGGAAGALGGLGRGNDDDEPDTHLSAVFLRMSVEAPGRDTQQYERAMMDLLGPAARAAGDAADFELTDERAARRAVQMLGSTRVLGQTGWLPEPYITARSLQGLMRSRQQLLGALHAYRAESGQQMGRLVEDRPPEVMDLLLLAHHRHALSAEPDAIALSGINLLGYERMVRWEDEQLVALEGFDIIENDVTVLGEAADRARQVRLEQGVLETGLEAELLDTEQPVRNAALMFERQSDQPWQLVRDVSELPEGVEADVQAHWRAALEAGHAIVVPGEMTDDEPAMWWRVDQRSGAALGMGPDGRGQALVEAAVTQIEAINTARGAAETVVALNHCLLTHGAAGAECCIRRTAASVMLNQWYGKAAGALAPPRGGPMYNIIAMGAGELFGNGLDDAMPGC